MIEITPEQWTEYEKRYKNLMWMISQRISGDTVFANLEDNYSDLRVAAVESIYGFHKKTGQSVDEMFENPLFNQYTKTCLWNHKNGKGKRMEKRRPFFSKCRGILQEDRELEVSGTPTSFEFDAENVQKDLSAVAQKALNIIMEDGGVLFSHGGVNIKKLASRMNESWREVRKAVNDIESKLRSTV